MTLREIEEMDVDVLTPKQVAGVLKCDPYIINIQAQQEPEKLGFPVIVAKSRVKIPREGFIRFMKGLNESERSVISQIEELLREKKA